MSHPVSDALAWVQYRLGATLDAAGHPLPDTSWSARLQQSEVLWMVLEGVHVLTIMLFVGSILFVDLRLLGVVWRKVPISAVSSSVLPFTVGGFAILFVTGLALFFANPLEYFHSFVFRIKAGLLLAAAVNVWVFHWRVQRDQAAWDNAPRPPAKARLAAGFSLALWLLVVVSGRYAAYDWFACDRATGFVSDFAGCAAYADAQAHAEAELAA